MSSKSTGRKRGRQHVQVAEDPMRYLMAYMIGLGHGARKRRLIAKGEWEGTVPGLQDATPYSEAFLARLLAFYCGEPAGFAELWGGDQYWQPVVTRVELESRITQHLLNGGDSQRFDSIEYLLQTRTKDFLDTGGQRSGVLRDRFDHLAALGAAVWISHCWPVGPLLPYTLAHAKELCLGVGEDRFFEGHLEMIVMARIGGPRLPWDPSLIFPQRSDLTP